MIEQDFSNVHLTKFEEKTLKKLSRGKHILYQPEYHRLRAKKFVDRPNYSEYFGAKGDVEDYLLISEKGAAYLSQKRREFFRITFTDIVDAVIAAAALIVSIVAIVLR